MHHSHPTRIDDAGILISIIGAVLSAGVSAWQLHFAHHRRLKEAKELIEQISQTLNTLTDDDKVAIDAYIAQVSATNQRETRCLLDTQRMLRGLAEYAKEWPFCSRCLTDHGTGLYRAQNQRIEVDEALAANSLFNFPWSDLAYSIKVLLRQCRDLHRSVQHSTTQGLQDRRRVSTPSATISSFIQQTPTPSTTTYSFSQQYQTPSPTISTFIQQPPSSYTGYSPSGSPYSHTGFTGISSLSGYSGHPIGGGPNYSYPPNPSSPTLPTGRGQPFSYNAGPSQPTYPPYPGQFMTPSATVSTTSLYPASTASQGQGSTRSLQTNQSAQYSSQYSASSGTSGYATAPSTYTTAGSSASEASSGSSASRSTQWSANASAGRR